MPAAQKNIPSIPQNLTKTQNPLFALTLTLFCSTKKKAQIMKLSSKQCITRTKLVGSSKFSSSSLQTIDHSNSKRALNPLFNLLPPNQNPNNIVDLIISSLMIRKTHPTLLRNDVESILSHLGPEEVSRVLLRCQSDHNSALQFFNWTRTDLGLKPTVRNYCHVIHILAWARQLTLAARLLRELVGDSRREDDVFEALVASSRGCNWSPFVFDMLVKAYVRTGLVREAFVSFGKSVDYGHVPTPVCCNFLLNALARIEAFEQCWIVYEEMTRIGISPNTQTFNTLTHVVSRSSGGDGAKVNAFIEEMESRRGFVADVVTYNILLGSYCRRGKLDEAICLYKLMYVRNVSPDLVSYTALMNGFGRSGRLKEAHQFFHRMVHRGFEPDVVAYNTLIRSYSEAGHMAACKALLRAMLADRVCPNNLTCKLLVRGYVKQRKLRSAFDLLEELERFGVRVSSENREFLIVALCRADRPFAAKRIPFDPPNGEIYGELVQSFCRRDYAPEALLAKQEMKNVGIEPDASVYKALVECLCRKGRLEEAELMLKEMVRSGFSPDSEVCRALVLGNCREDEKGFEKAESTLVFFAKEFGICDTESYNVVVKALGERGDLTELFDFQNRMRRAGFTPNVLTCKYVIEGLRRS